MKCDKCKKEFIPGNKADGTPNGVGFELQDGSVITLCAACLMKLGSLDEKGKDKFFKELGY